MHRYINWEFHMGKIRVYKCVLNTHMMPICAATCTNTNTHPLNTKFLLYSHARKSHVHILSNAANQLTQLTTFLPLAESPNNCNIFICYCYISSTLLLITLVRDLQDQGKLDLYFKEL